MRGRLQMLFLLIAITLFPPLRSAMNQPPAAPVYVTLWFDTEDYILPQSDTAAKRLAETLTRLGRKNTNDYLGDIALRQGKFTTDRYVAEDSPRLWGWVIFPEGFHAPKIIELARLQAWTLKPALLQK